MTQQQPKRVLFATEWTAISTGFAAYGLELFRRLHATGKYDLCEVASYARPEDPRIHETPWKLIPVVPARGDEEHQREYDAHRQNEFGRLVWEEACLLHLPDVCCAFRDPWMDAHLVTSPLRPYYTLGLMPTVDAEPLQRDWLELYEQADGLFAYSDWGLEVLRTQSGGRAKTRCPAPYGGDPAAFRMLPDRKGLRRRAGLDENCFLVGMVARNNMRKLFPDLFEAFRLFLEEAPSELAKRSYLYLHTAWPDLAWDLPRLARDCGLSSRVLFTYACAACGHVFPAFQADPRSHCPACGRPEAGYAHSSHGVSRATLCEIYNLFDCYVQYASMEGSGLPQIEAALCGLHVFSVDYSAMSDVVRKVRGTPVKVASLFREAMTHRLMACPDDRDLVEKLGRFAALPEPVRLAMGHRARVAALAHYDWDRTAAAWTDFLDEAPPRLAGWLAPPRPHEPERHVPDLPPGPFVAWALVHVAGRPDLVSTWTAARMARDLEWGYSFAEGPEADRPRRRPYGREDVVSWCYALCQKRNHWEARRAERARVYLQSGGNG